jgi:putative transcriptional regulator
MPKVENGLRELRQERGWTQGELAAVIGVSRQSINSIERNRYTPSLELALEFSRLFECPTDEIFWLSEEDS